MERQDTWQQVRKHLSEMLRTIDSALRKVPPFSSFVQGEYPPVSIYETDEELVVRAEVPGVPAEDLNVTLRSGVLLIEGARAAEEHEGYSCSFKERPAGEFCREIPLPCEVDEDAELTASLENGLLTVRLKKRPRQAGKTIRVEVR